MYTYLKGRTFSNLNVTERLIFQEKRNKLTVFLIVARAETEFEESISRISVTEQEEAHDLRSEISVLCGEGQLSFEIRVKCSIMRRRLFQLSSMLERPAQARERSREP